MVYGGRSLGQMIIISRLVDEERISREVRAQGGIGLSRDGSGTEEDVVDHHSGSRVRSADIKEINAGALVVDERVVHDE